MKRFHINLGNGLLLQLALVLCLEGAFASVWKSQTLDISPPVFSVTQSKVVATVYGQVFELAPDDSVWKLKLISIPGTVLAADSFHYFGNGTVLGPDLPRFPEVSSIPDFCCSFRFAENAKRFYISGANGRTFFSEKSSPGWKPLSTPPPFSDGYQLIPFPNHYLLVGAFDILISHNRGETWEKVKGLPALNESTRFVKKFGSELFASFGPREFFRSSDSGQTWSRLFEKESPYAAHDFNGAAIAGDTIWLTAYDGHQLNDMPEFTWSQGILRSVDSGKNWEWFHQGLPNIAAVSEGKTTEWFPTYGIHHVAGELWTSGFDANSNSIPYRSRDGGLTWQAVNAGLNLGTPLSPESIGNEIRLLGRNESGVDEYYAFDKALNLWVLDTLLAPLKIRNHYSVGDTIYGQGEGYFRRKTGSAGKWENLFPTTLQRDFQYHPNGTEYIGISIFQGFRMEHSDDGGKTWSSGRPFLPQTQYRGRKVEARGSRLLWPDDSLFSPPELWREFDNPIGKLWNWQDGILVQSGGRLFHAAESGGAWRELSLPDTNLVFVIDENRLTGYAPSQVFTLLDVGSQWASRKVRFPMPRILGLAKSSDYLFYLHNAHITHDPTIQSWLSAGYSSKGIAKRSGFTYLNQESLIYASSSYQFSSYYSLNTNRAAIDTVNYGIVPLLYFSQAGGRLLKTPTLRARALFADGNMMAMAHDGAKVSYSKDRGESWQETSSPPNITSFAGDAGRLFAVADSVLHELTDNGSAWVSAGVLARKIKQVAGTPSYLAVLTHDDQIQVTTDSAKTWTTLPLLPPGPAALPTAIAAYGNEVFVGTQEFGIFGWGDGKAISIRQGAGPEAGKKPQENLSGPQALRPIPRGWFRVPGQPGQSINAKGQLRLQPPEMP